LTASIGPDHPRAPVVLRGEGGAAQAPVSPDFDQIHLEKSDWQPAILVGICSTVNHAARAAAGAHLRKQLQCSATGGSPSALTMRAVRRTVSDEQPNCEVATTDSSEMARLRGKNNSASLKLGEWCNG